MIKAHERIIEVKILDKVRENSVHTQRKGLIIEKIRAASCTEMVKKRKEKNRSRRWYFHRLSPEKIEMFLSDSFYFHSEILGNYQLQLCT